MDKGSLASCASLNFFPLSAEFYHLTISKTDTVFEIHWPAIPSCIFHMVHYVRVKGLKCCIYYHLHACYMSRTPHYFFFHYMLVSKIKLICWIPLPSHFSNSYEIRGPSHQRITCRMEKFTMSLITVHKIFLRLKLGPQFLWINWFVSKQT